jgi:MerR family transcriptional regulator, mercuric resistance operon regulatory protein
LTRYLRTGFMLCDVRTSEVADQAGVNAQTLRYYERRGLLPEPPRSPGGYREYPVSAVSVLRFVKRAQELGFTLTEIEELLELAEGGPDSCARARSLAETHTAGLEAKIADLRRMRDSLGALIATCELPRADRDCPLLQALDGLGALS